MSRVTITRTEPKPVVEVTLIMNEAEARWLRDIIGRRPWQPDEQHPQGNIYHALDEALR
jgi:hypothetical protein